MEARDQHKTGNKCTSYNKAWLRRTREAAHKHGAIACARASCRQSHSVKWTLLPFCEMRQTFTRCN